MASKYNNHKRNIINFNWLGTFYTIMYVYNKSTQIILRNVKSKLKKKKDDTKKCGIICLILKIHT